MKEVKDDSYTPQELDSVSYTELAPPSSEEIQALAERKEYSKIKAIACELQPIDLAEIFIGIDSKYHATILRLLPKEEAAELFCELDSEIQTALVASFTDVELSTILDELYLDDTVDIIEEMPALLVKKIIRASRGENREEINRLLGYDKESAGAIMTTEYVRLKPDQTVREALSHIKKVAIDKETIYTCYVTDAQRHLLGIVSAKALLLSDGDTRLSDIMEENVVYASTTTNKEDVARIFDKYGFLALPVVDSEERLVGIVTVDDAISVIREETEEDFQKMAGITPTDTSYFRQSVGSLWLARIPWLLLLMISATVSSTILSGFEAALPAVLVLFVPMLMDTGGNSGGQSSVTIIRSLSLGEIRNSDFPAVLWKEVRVGALAGVTLAAVSFAKVMLVDRLIMNNPDVTLFVALAVSVSLGITILVSKMIGASLPILAKRLGFDPAVMASPFITTVVDAASLLLYFVIAAYGFGL